jgi:flavin reductase (DIM6/NTAB) family NADH-FMN oxidoreductase RutF
MEDRRTFNKLVAELDYPMFIVSTCVGDERAGCLIGFATQISIHPPRFLVGLSHKNHTHRLALRAEMLAVHFVPEDNEGLAELFGGETGDEIDKFERCDWHPGPGGVPIVEGCANWFVGRVVGRVDAGDHTAFLLEPVAAQRAAAEDEFTFHRAKRIEPGHEP